MSSKEKEINEIFSGFHQKLFNKENNLIEIECFKYFNQRGESILELVKWLCLESEETDRIGVAETSKLVISDSWQHVIRLKSLLNLSSFRILTSETERKIRI